MILGFMISQLLKVLIKFNRVRFRMEPSKITKS